MSDIEIRQMPAFKKVYKKLPAAYKSIVNEAVRTIINNPKIGEEKKEDLIGVYVYKFKINHQQFLLAYEWDPALRILLALDVHENFYRDLRDLKRK
ncbi:type II toxin-antitoxin system RelE/ParE family toxin [Legionella sp. PATHC032]|uniref:type II toxin-antitoxin system RelE/ParE family toxin n=1 Tax=Legionella sp. PATHC032 TaxID=2992039 RepID=UPI002243D88F|nr:type II toxin-antitoxin system RelE/ParE family toxin [Legionella sp. PATHC032]MCW8420169.1 type II toxin-antitoxin system RelE/ParE family toxin [Legionella sp. PATHC032]